MSAKSDFKEAIKRIARAKEKSLPKLDLNALPELAELPTEIGALAKLKYLNIIGTNIADITPIAGMSSLVSLCLYSSPVEELAAISELKNLSSLILIDTKVTKLDSIAKLTALRRLELDGSNVYDLKPLSMLTGLRRLGLSNSTVADLSPLTNLIDLVISPEIVSVGDTIHGGLSFTNCAAAKADPRIAEIADIPDPATRARELFDYLDTLPNGKLSSSTDPIEKPRSVPVPATSRQIFLPAVSQISSAQLTEVLRSSYPDLRQRAGHLLSLVQQEIALHAMTAIPNELLQVEEHRAKQGFLDTMKSGLSSLAEDLPEAPLPATKENAKLLKDRLKALAKTLDESISYLDSHEGTYGGLWKIGVVSAVAGLLAVVPGVTFLPATLLPAAVLGVQSVKLTISRGKDQKN